MPTTNTCANCGQDIYNLRTTDSGTALWRHRDVRSRAGCRGASYRSDTGWDDSIPRDWKARPLQPGKVPKMTPSAEQMAERRAEVDAIPPLDDRTAKMATLIAMAVRNGLEELHGGDVPNSLTDEQMAKINPIVRNATATALLAFRHPSNQRLARWLDFQAMLVPDYWERPELVDDL